MLFRDYCKYLADLEAESSRLKLADILVNLLKNLSHEEIAGAMYMLTGRIVPDYVSLEFNFSVKSLLGGLASREGQLGAQTESAAYPAKQRYGELGDIGLVVEEFMQMQPAQSSFLQAQERDWELTAVQDVLREIISFSGKGANKAKQEKVVETISRMEIFEAKYFARIVTGDLRLGVSKKTVLDAISIAKTGTKELRAALDYAFGLKCDLGILAQEVLLEGVDLTAYKLQPGVPVASQLVEREVDSQAILKRIPKAIVQPKYDGLRAQLHYSRAGFELEDGFELKSAGDGEEVEDSHFKIFSRNLEPLGHMFPELKKLMEQQEIESIVLDGEIIGFDETTQTFLPFQETIQRKRKYGVEEAAQDIPIKYFAFDMLYLNGEDLTETPLAERLNTLRELKFNDPKNTISKTESPVFDDASALDTYFRKLLDEGLEGVIVKAPESFYSPGKRGFDWIKMKANTFADLKDTVDCVVMGYYYGRGNRARFGIGGFLVGIYDDETETYHTVAKLGSGVKEEEWPVYKQELEKLTVKEIPKNYQIAKELMPDFLVQPEIVVEIDADQITLSKLHSGGRGAVAEAGDKGFSLRFPRLKKWRRDKKSTQTTTVAELKSLYEMSIKR